MIGIHRYRTILRQSSTEQICIVIQGDTHQREYISCKGRVCTKRCRATNLPEHIALGSSINHEHSGVAGCCERAPDLENEDGIGITLAVEGERASQLCRCAKTVDAWCKREST